MLLCISVYSPEIEWLLFGNECRAIMHTVCQDVLQTARGPERWVGDDTMSCLSGRDCACVQLDPDIWQRRVWEMAARLRSSDVKCW